MFRRVPLRHAARSGPLSLVSLLALGLLVAPLALSTIVDLSRQLDSLSASLEARAMEVAASSGTEDFHFERMTWVAGSGDLERSDGVGHAGLVEKPPVQVPDGVRALLVTPVPNQSKQEGDPDPDHLGFRLSDPGVPVRGAITRVAGEVPGRYEFRLGTLSAGDSIFLVLATDAFTIAPGPDRTVGPASAFRAEWRSWPFVAGREEVTAEAGSPVVLRFRLLHEGVTVRDRAMVLGVQTSPTTCIPSAHVELPSAAGGAGRPRIRFDRRREEFTLRWPTPPTPGVCHMVRIAMADDVELEARVRLR